MILVISSSTSTCINISIHVPEFIPQVLKKACDLLYIPLCSSLPLTLTGGENSESS